MGKISYKNIVFADQDPEQSDFQPLYSMNL